MSIAVQADGKILVGGGFNERTASAGRRATTSPGWKPTAGSTRRSISTSSVGSIVFATAVQPDGKILIGGNFTQRLGRGAQQHCPVEHGRHTRHWLLTRTRTASCLMQSRCRRTARFWWAASLPNSIGGQPRNRIARLDPTTGLADSFDPNADASVSAIAVQADGKILVGGHFTSVGGQTRNHIARLDPTTGLADSFNPNAND